MERPVAGSSNALINTYICTLLQSRFGEKRKEEQLLSVEESTDFVVIGNMRNYL